MSPAGEAATSCRDTETLCDQDAQAREDALLLLAMIDVGRLAKSSAHEVLYRYAGAHEDLDAKWLAINAEQKRRNAAYDAMKLDIERRKQAVDYWQRADAVEALRRILEGKKARSEKTPFGPVGFRKKSAHLVISNEAAIEEQWRRRETKVVESIDKRAMDAEFRRTGEVPAGAEVEPERDEFYLG